MYETVAYCGLDCARCPACLATQRDDPDELARVAVDWSEEFGMEVKPEMIVCDGCKADSGRLCAFCSICLARDCALAKGVVTCAHCDEYICDTLASNTGYKFGGDEGLARIRRELEA